MFSKFFQSTTSKVLAGVAAGYIVSNHAPANLSDSYFYNQFINPFNPYSKRCANLPLCNECKVQQFTHQSQKSDSNSSIKIDSFLSQEWNDILESEKFVSDLTKELKRRYDNGEQSGTIVLVDDLGVPVRFIPDSQHLYHKLDKKFSIYQTFLPEGCKLTLRGFKHEDARYACLFYAFDYKLLDKKMIH